jgi:hypothetical protein
VALLTHIILALATMIMLIGGVDGFVVERDILASTMNRRREMMGSSIKNSNVEVTISQNPVEALRHDRLVLGCAIKSQGTHQEHWCHWTWRGAVVSRFIPRRSPSTIQCI